MQHCNVISVVFIAVPFVIQGHFSGEPINIGRLTDIIDELSQFSLPIWVTEFDWAGDNVRHIRELYA